MVDVFPRNNPLQDAIDNQQSKAPRESKDESQRRKCQAMGGVWDSATQTCRLPGEDDKKQVNTFSDESTGELSGFTVRGKTFLGVRPEDVVAGTTRQTLKRELPIGGEAETVINRRQEQLQETGFQEAGRVGPTTDPDVLESLRGQITAGQVDYLGAVASAVPGIIPSAISFASTAAGGAIVAGQAGPQAAFPEEIITVPVAATIGAIIGGVKGFYQDFVRDVQRQKREIIETPIRTLTETKSILNDIIAAQNANPSNAVENREAFNNQLALIDLERQRLKEETDSNLNKFLGDTGINQLQEYEVYYVTDGERDRQIEEMRIALANPDPSRIRPSEVTLADIEKSIQKELARVSQ